MTKILQGKIDIISETSMQVEIWDVAPEPDVKLFTQSGFSDETKAKEYILGLEGMSYKSADYLAGVQKALDLLAV